MSNQEFDSPVGVRTLKAEVKAPSIMLMAALILLIGAAALRFGNQGLPTSVASDRVLADEIARRASATSALAPIYLRGVGPQDQATAITAMALPAADQKILMTDLAAHRTRLVWVAFYDSDTEDGDTITVRSAGFSQMLRLTKAPVAMAIPEPPDGLVKIEGAVDGGGGGVTVGMATTSGSAALAVLSVGQQISIPIALK